LAKPFRIRIAGFGEGRRKAGYILKQKARRKKKEKQLGVFDHVQRGERGDKRKGISSKNSRAEDKAKRKRWGEVKSGGGGNLVGRGFKEK